MATTTTIITMQTLIKKKQQQTLLQQCRSKTKRNICFHKWQAGKCVSLKIRVR